MDEETRRYFPFTVEREIVLNYSLRKDSIGFRETMFQGIASAAPAGAAVSTLTGAAAFALGSLPLTAFIGFIIVLLNAIVINRISVKVSGAGGYYEYVKAAYGPRVALFTGLFYIFYQIMALTLESLSVAIFAPPILFAGFGIDLPSIVWLPLFAVTLMFGFLVSYSGIRGSTRFTMIMALVEISLIVGFGMCVLLSHPSINTATVFTPRYAHDGYIGVGLGVLLMYTAFSGFGASTPLGEESKNPGTAISRSVIFSVVILGAFFIFTSYFFTVAWGPANMSGYVSGLVPGISIIHSYLGLIATAVIAILFINSLLTGSVVLVNGTSRVMMAMGRDGIIPERISRIHSVRKTPYIAAGIMTLASFIIGFAGVNILGGFPAFIMAAVAATLGVLFVHAMINVSLPRIEKRYSGRMSTSGLALSAVTVVIFALIFYSTFLSISLPVILGTVLFIAWIAFNFMYVFLAGDRLHRVEINGRPDQQRPMS